MSRLLCCKLLLQSCNVLLCLNTAACNAESYLKVGLVVPAVMSDDEVAQDSMFQKFPSIGHLKHLYKHLRVLKLLETVNSTKLQYEGTVKVHGSHCDLISAEPTAEWQLQSRNRILTAEADNCGFVKFVQDNAAAVQGIIWKIRDRSGGKHVTLSGEICGKGVQSGVGISQQVEKFVVILNVKVDDLWQSVDVWEDLSNESHRIYNIRQFPRYHVTIDMIDPMASLNEIEKVTKDVGTNCPVAAALGTPGSGEGIVWIPQEHHIGLHSRVWFKSKTEEHMVTPARNRIAKPASQSLPVSDTAAAAMEFVQDNLTTARLQQGLDYLREFNMQADSKHLGHFLRWVAEDTIKEDGQDLGAEVIKASKKIIANRGKTWYICHMQQN